MRGSNSLIPEKHTCICSMVIIGIWSVILFLYLNSFDCVQRFDLIITHLSETLHHALMGKNVIILNYPMICQVLKFEFCLHAFVSTSL